MTAPLTAKGQYATAIGTLSSKGDPNLVANEEDQIRIAAYKLYEDMYYNRPETFKILLRGDDDDQKPIYLPAAKKIVEAMNRFVAVDFNFSVNPTEGDEADQMECRRLLGNLFKREKVLTKFATQRRNGLIRGDSLWHITADDTKEQGSRVSMHELNPANYFPILDPDNPDRLWGCHIVDVIQDAREKDDKTKVVARRQTYLREGVTALPGGGFELPEGAELGGVMTSLTLWEIGKWDDRNLKTEDLEQVQVIRAPEKLPDEIDVIPVYHTRNRRISESDFGLSEISGIETLLTGLNQGISDEDATLVMQGLGMYWTNAKPPINEDGTTADWEIGPGAFIEVGEGNTVGRLTGVSSITPYQEHLKYLENFAFQANAIPEVAAGRVDVTIAESGISLKLQMAPLIQAGKEKEEEMLSVHDQMVYDLVQKWFPAYEQASFEGVVVACTVGDPMPVNREAMIQEIMLLQAAGLITIAMAQAKLMQFGYEFETGDDTKVLREAAAIAQAADGMVNRYAQESEAKSSPQFEAEEDQIIAPTNDPNAANPAVPSLT